MPRIEVEPGALQGGAGQAEQLAGELTSISGQLQAAAAQVGSALADGDDGASDALTAWASALTQVSGYSAGLGTNLGAAAGVYLRTDSSAIGGDG